MKNYSARSFLSFFICLVICIPHSSHSLSTSHILHKRMQLVADGKNAAELSGELGKSTIGKSDGLGATTTNGVKSSSDSRWFRKTANLDQGGLPINHKLPRPSWTERLAQIWERFQRALSRISQTLRNVFRIQVDNDSAFDRNPDLWKMVADPESIDPKVNYGLMAKIRDSLPAAQDDSAYEAKVEELRKSFHKLDDIQKVNEKTYVRVVKNHEIFSEEITPMLMRSRGKILSDLRDQKLQPIEILARRMAHLRSKSLAEDKKILSKVLPSDQAYMSSLLGQMGPGEVLTPWFKAMVREKVESKELIFKQGKEEFISRLQLMEIALAGLAKLHQKSDLALLSEEDKELLNVYTREIGELDKGLSISFGGRDEFKASLERIKSMNFHKGFMMELERPGSSQYSYDLQFVEPLRYLGQDIREEEKQLINQQLGIQLEEHDISTIKQQAPFALQNYKEFLEIFLKIREEEMKILKIISPNQLKSLTKYQIPEKGSKVVDDSQLVEDSPQLVEDS